MTWTEELRDDLVAAARERGARRRARRVRRGAAVVAIVALSGGVGAIALSADDTPPRAPAQDPAVAAAAPKAYIFDGTRREAVVHQVAAALGTLGVPTVGWTSRLTHTPGDPDRWTSHVLGSMTVLYAAEGYAATARRLADEALHLPFAPVQELAQAPEAVRHVPAQVVIVIGADLQDGIARERTVALRAPGGVAGPPSRSGTARVTGDDTTVVTVDGLAAGGRYGLWVGGRFSGLLDAPATGTARRVAVVKGARGAVLVTRERTTRPRAPGPVLLAGDLG